MSNIAMFPKEDERDKMSSVNGMVAITFDRMVSERRQIERQKDNLKVCTAAWRDSFKHAGGNLKALNLVLKTMEMEPEESDKFWACVEAYGQRLNAFGRQPSLFPIGNDTQALASLVDKHLTEVARQLDEDISKMKDQDRAKKKARRTKPKPKAPQK